ncbi:XRE family transcriptional regulator [bacterium]|nr:XRE family transcriptional regulator [bacterium]
MKLSKLIMKSGYTIRQLAEELKLSKNAVYSYTCGRSYPSAKTLMAMCKVLGYEESEILKAIKEAKEANLRYNECGIIKED